MNADVIAGSAGELLSANVFAYCQGNPVTLKDPDGFRPMEAANPNEETDDMREASLAIMNNRYDYNTGTVKASLGVEGEPNSVGQEYDKNGNLTKERWYDENGRAVKDKHYTDHGNAKKHPKVPHEHDWGYDENGNWTLGPWYSTPINKIKITIGAVGGTYLIYRGVRMLPSLLPPLWWTIPENVAIP